MATLILLMFSFFSLIGSTWLFDFPQLPNDCLLLLCLCPHPRPAASETLCFELFFPPSLWDIVLPPNFARLRHCVLSFAQLQSWTDKEILSKVTTKWYWLAPGVLMFDCWKSWSPALSIIDRMKQMRLLAVSRSLPSAGTSSQLGPEFRVSHPTTM